MTEEFRELTSRLAKGLNFPLAMAILITQDENSEDVEIMIKGRGDPVANGICSAADRILSEMKPDDAWVFREALKNVIATDEERRFQRKLEDDNE